MGMRVEVLGAEASPEPGVSSVDARARALTTTESTTPASFRDTVLSIVAPAPMGMSAS